MVHVVSCRFLRLSCSEDDHPLFQQEYARSNRERGVKLLRCFPHCCPEHARRSYCGCSVHVLVTFSTDVSAAAAATAQDELLVCARFEPSRVAPLWPAGLEGIARSIGASVSLSNFGNDNSDDSRREDERSLEIGEQVALPASLFGPAGRISSRDSVWIRADRESDTKQQALPKNSVLYVINNRRFPKWFYSYDSSTTRQQRDMTHHLVAYVLQLSGEQRGRHRYSRLDERDETFHGAIVLGRHASPGFLLISYRRSVRQSHTNPVSAVPAVDSPPNSNGPMTHDMNDIKRASQECLVYSPGIPHKNGPASDNQRHDRRQSSLQASRGYESKAPAPSEAKTNAFETESSYDASAGTAHDEDAGSSWQYGWQARGCDFQDKGQQLLILWRFLQCVRIMDIGLFADLHSASVRSLWLQVAAAIKVPPIPPRAGEGIQIIVSCLLQSRTKRPAHQASATIEAVTHLFLRALSSSTIQRHLLDAVRDGSDAASKEQLHQRFVLLVSGLHKCLSDVLQETNPDFDAPLPGNQVSSLSALVDDVLSLIYGHEQFGVLREEVSALLLGHRASGSLTHALNRAFQVYTAQTREAMITSVTRTRQSTRVQHANVAPSTNAAWSRRWLVEPGSVQVLDITAGTVRSALHHLSLVDVAQTVLEFGCVDAVMGECLSLRSSLSCSGSMLMSPLMLVLDGRFRVFRALPSGLSSMIETTGGWSVGDYAAELSKDGHTLSINLFGFVESSKDVFAHHVTRSRSNQESAVRDDGSEPGVILVRRVGLSITLERELHAGEREDLDVFLFVHGTVFDSAYYFPASGLAEGHKLSAKSSTDRAAIWGELKWTPLYELQARYTAM